ncbi:hypothetical protein BH09PAT2_BH09PAT2_00980 [soil metagenome]
MSYQIQEQSFGALFKKHRLRSEIETLSEFGDLLAQEGLQYETSLFTRWQNGERVPRDRRVLLTIIRLFIKLDGIQNIHEIDSLLESTNQKPLSIEEKYQLSYLFSPSSIDTLPNLTKIFFFSSPIFQQFDTYVNTIYKEIEIHGYRHIYHETQTHKLRYLIKKVEEGIDSYIAEYKDNILQAIELVKDADICIFEASSKSIGTGYLIHQALDFYKPTIVLYYKENKPHIFSVKIDKNLTLKSFNEINIKKVVENVLKIPRQKITL